MSRPRRSGGSWRERQERDPYVQQARKDGWRSRAVYKLEEIDKKERLLKPDMVCIDLGSAPGSWSQYVGEKQKGRARIIALDLLDTKLASASSLGATDALVVDQHTAARVTEQTAGGVDHAIEASGTLEGFDLAMRLVRRGGTVTTLGLPGPGMSHGLELAPLVASGVTIRGSYLGSCETQRDVPRFIELYREGRFPADALVSHRIGLDDINLALDRLADGEALRQVIEF